MNDRLAAKVWGSKMSLLVCGQTVKERLTSLNMHLHWAEKRCLIPSTTMISLTFNNLHLRAKGCERGRCPRALFFSACTIPSHNKEKLGSFVAFISRNKTSQEIWWHALCLEMQYGWSHRPQSVCIITARRPVPTPSSKWQRIAAYRRDQNSRKTCGSSFERVLDKRILVGCRDWNTQATH